MSDPFASIVSGQLTPNDSLKNMAVNTPALQGLVQSADLAQGGGVSKSRDKSHPVLAGNAVVLRHPAAPEQSPLAQYLDASVDVEALPTPVVRFPGTKMVLPDKEVVCQGLSGIAAEIAPEPPPIIERKDQVPYYIAGTLKDAELKNATLRAQKLSRGQSTIGKQRSSSHIETLGPALFLDDDGDVFAREALLRATGMSAIIYSSHSYGFPKGSGTEPSLGGRVVLLLNRPVTPSEYGPIWDAVNHLLGGGFDEHGRSPAQCFGHHARRSDQAPYKRIVISGVALDADALIRFGRSLRPEPIRPASGRKTEIRRRRAVIEQIERAKLLGAVRPPDDYGEWASGAAAFKRASPNDIEAAFQCYDVWSACSSKYDNKEATRRKFDQVPADYDGTAIPVTLDMLHWRARRRAEAVIGILYSPMRHWQKKGNACERSTIGSLADGIPRPKGAEPIPPNSLKPEDGIMALEYLLFCWSNEVFQQVTREQDIPETTLQNAQRRCKERHNKIDLAGRTLHKWDGKNLAADTAALAQAIIASETKLYRVDQTLVRISTPISDPATADRVRRMHGYEESPGKPNDPALHAGERLVPILPADAEALREIIASRVATERLINEGTKKEPVWSSEITSYSFKPSAKVHEEPDAGVLKDLLKRELVNHVPEIVGVVTAPVMPDLPAQPIQTS